MVAAEASVAATEAPFAAQPAAVVPTGSVAKAPAATPTDVRALTAVAEPARVVAVGVWRGPGFAKAGWSATGRRSEVGTGPLAGPKHGGCRRCPGIIKGAGGDAIKKRKRRRKKEEN